MSGVANISEQHTIKIIISHDVDHLFRDDHYRDLIYPKLWGRETLAALHLRGKISFNEWRGRLAGTFRKERHHIRELSRFDKSNGVEATYYFGMANGLGMSYKKEKALDIINELINEDIPVGIHGIDYQNYEKMSQEYNDFVLLTGKKPDGIRMHYVRFDDDTFKKLSEIGYLYDTTKFYKKKCSCIEKPYRVGGMWEFPLCVMDGYLSSDLEKSKEETLRYLYTAEEIKLPYFTVLFHDYQFTEEYKTPFEWYKWFVNYCNAKGYEFIDYRNAVKELNCKYGYE